MKQSLQIMIKSVLLLLCSVSVALAATVTIVPSGGNSYAVMGGSMDGVAGIDLSISYDPASLSSPSVNQGTLVSGAMFLANANNPGNIKIAVITTTAFKGNGQIAAISFGSQIGSGGIAGVNASMIDISGKPIPVQTAIAPAATTPLPSNAPETSAVITTGITSTASPASASSSSSSTTAVTALSSSLGSVNLPADTQQPNVAAPGVAATAQARPAPALPQQEKATEPPAAVFRPVAAAEPAAIQVVYSGVLERFLTYQGVKTPAALMELFRKPIANTIRQEPAIVVSDGKSVFRLIADLPAGSAISPNFALSGAKLVSLKSGEVPGRWIVEAMPTKSVLKSTVTILQGGSIYEYPLTAVPPLAAVSGKEADFAAFLKDSGAKVPKFDLNADGKHDYQDDYIYAAHYLILKGSGLK